MRHFSFSWKMAYFRFCSGILCRALKFLEASKACKGFNYRGFSRNRALRDRNSAIYRGNSFRKAWCSLRNNRNGKLWAQALCPKSLHMVFLFTQAIPKFKKMPLVSIPILHIKCGIYFVVKNHWTCTLLQFSLPVFYIGGTHTQQRKWKQLSTVPFKLFIFVYRDCTVKFIIAPVSFLLSLCSASRPHACHSSRYNIHFV